MLIDLKLADKNIVIVGGGNVGERKAKKFLEAGSHVCIVSENFTKGLKKLRRKRGIKLVKVKVQSDASLIAKWISKSDIVISATDNSTLNEAIAREAKKSRIPMCAVDNPSISDFTFPAIAEIGDFRIAISTEGKSPAMARILRKRIEETITPEDLLQVKLQDYIRKLVKSKIPNRKLRKNILYKIIHSKEINDLLKEDRFKEAKKKAEKMIVHNAHLEHANLEDS